MEAPVRQTVQRLLPAWAHTETDTAGNLWLKVGSGDPVVVFVAHTDEIGYRVSAIRDDGTLEIRPLGGFFPSLFEARPALVHTGGKPVPGVFTPRDSMGGHRAAPPAPSAWTSAPRREPMRRSWASRSAAPSRCRRSTCA